jgi:site-specific DNA recombinase
MSKTTTKRCALYIRVSTLHQANGYSLDTQKALLVRHARDKGYEVVGIYRDVGLSAKNTNRPELQRLLADARARRFDLVLVWRIDRISRSLKDLKWLIDELHEHGVEFAAADQQFDTSDPAGLLTLHVLGSFAQFEREILVERIKESQVERLKMSDWSCGPVPFGYRKVDGKLVEEPDEAKVVRRMFETFLKRKSIRGIVTRLNEEGVRTRRGNLWSGFVVKQMLINPVYTGASVYGRHASGDTRIKPREEWTVLPGKHEAVVEQGVFDQVQGILESRPRGNAPQGPPVSYPLAGKLRCPKCGGPMFGSTRRKGGKVYRYYKCNTSRHKGRAACEGTSVRAEEAEQQGEFLAR